MLRVLYHIYRHLKNDHICEIGRFLYGQILLLGRQLLSGNIFAVYDTCFLGLQAL